ncbi:MAG: CarD family transcriptional regulator [Deltaproteobacteria bacterium]|nr:MAG: CarD family transcriptional regulator [Deltaproteobacteria bacterium]
MAHKGPEIQIGDGSLHVGDRVVYPNQGICKITGVEVKQIAGRDWEMVTLSREEDGATVMVPRSKVMEIGLRKVASVEAIDTMFDQLAAPSDDPQLDWKVRHRENADRMTGGGLQGTLDVLKGLHALSQVRPLPQKERELYDNARHLLVGEIAAAMNIPLHVAEDNLDYALFPPPGMKRKGMALKPAALTVPGAAAALRSREEDDDEDLGLEEERTPAAGETEPADAVAADEEETEIADRSETKDLVRQRVMRVAAQADEPEPLDELAAEALEATHEDEAARPTRVAHEPPGSTRPEAKRGARKSSARPKVGPGQGEEPKGAPEASAGSKDVAKGARQASGLAKAIAAKALEAAAKAIAPASKHEMPKNWNRRFKHNRDKMKTGDIFELAEVVRNLSLRDGEKGLSTGEKQMYVKAKKILASELRFAKNLSEEDAIAWLEGVLTGHERPAAAKPKRATTSAAATKKKPAAKKAPARKAKR